MPAPFSVDESPLVDLLRNRSRKRTFWHVDEDKTGVITKIILVVNTDEAEAWLIAHTILHERRYNTLFASGCSEALYLVRHILPHLFIFAYRNSPGKGLQCYDVLAAMASGTAIPTIFISPTSIQIEDEAKRRNLVLLEPSFEKSHLLDLVDQLLMVRRS